MPTHTQNTLQAITQHNRQQAADADRRRLAALELQSQAIQNELERLVGIVQKMAQTFEKGVQVKVSSSVDTKLDVKKLGEVIGQQLAGAIQSQPIETEPGPAEFTVERDANNNIVRVRRESK